VIRADLQIPDKEKEVGAPKSTISYLGGLALNLMAPHLLSGLL
jgi:hypothetical protein